MAMAASSGVGVRRLVASRARLREARMAPSTQPSAECSTGIFVQKHLWYTAVCSSAVFVLFRMNSGPCLRKPFIHFEIEIPFDTWHRGGRPTNLGRLRASRPTAAAAAAGPPSSVTVRPKRHGGGR